MLISPVMTGCLRLCIYKCVGVALAQMKAEVQLQNGNIVKRSNHEVGEDVLVKSSFCF